MTTRCFGNNYSTGRRCARKCSTGYCWQHGGATQSSTCFKLNPNDNRILCQTPHDRFYYCDDDITGQSVSGVNNYQCNPNKGGVQSYNCNLFPGSNVSGPYYRCNVPILRFPGLKWSSNNCYFNSSLFMLLTITPLMLYLLENRKYYRTKIGNSMVKDFVEIIVNIFGRMDQKNLSHHLAYQKNICQKIPGLKWGNQNDAHEIINYLLDEFAKQVGIRNGYGPPKDYEAQVGNIVDNLLVSTVETQLLDCPGKWLPTIKQYVFELEMIFRSNEDILKKQFTISELIERNFEVGRLDVYCDPLDKNVTTRTQKLISKFPKYLILHIKRKISEDIKLNNVVDYSQDIQFPKDNILKSLKSNPIYRLQAVVYHSGSASGGHYFTKAITAGRWWKYNDETVTPITQSAISDSGSGKAELLLFRAV